MFFKKYFDAFISLFFPDLCFACDKQLQEGEVQICTSCHADLPYADFHTYADNPVAKQFWGRVEVKDAMALLYFVKGGRAQHLIHNLKYRGRTEVGLMLGRLIGLKLQLNLLYRPLDIILPVPLHPARRRKRGYNQSYFLALGIHHVLQLNTRDDILFRSRETATQTKRSRFSRFENMLEVFKVRDPPAIKGLHVLLVDDVVTTGATLEACTIKLLDAGAASVSIAVAAFSE